MNSLRIAGVLSRPHVPSLLKSGPHFSPLISKRASISSLWICRIATDTSDVYAAISSMEPRTDLVTKTQMEKEKEKQKEKVELSCPVCYRPLTYSGFESPNLLTVKKSKLRCKNCQKSYDMMEGLLILHFPMKESSPKDRHFSSKARQRNPLVAFIYERGYWDVFAAFNFPGFDEETEMARKLLEPARGETIIDLSCGPGGFTRRFLVGGEYETVIAADFSLAMLEQCRGFLESDASADLSGCYKTTIQDRISADKAAIRQAIDELLNHPILHSPLREATAIQHAFLLL